MIKKNLSNCLKEVFRKERIPKNIENLKFGSFDSWDSLAHLNFLLLIEKKFKVKFSFEEMYKIKTIKEIIHKINKYK